MMAATPAPTPYQSTTTLNTPKEFAISTVFVATIVICHVAAAAPACANTRGSQQEVDISATRPLPLGLAVDARDAARLRTLTAPAAAL